MPFCSQCGTDVSGVSFCPKCGAAVASGDPSAAEGSPQTAGTSAGAGTPPAGAAAGSADISENIAAALAYITPVAIVLLLIDPYKRSRFVRFHSFQSIFFTVAAIITGIGFGVLGGILSLVGIGFFIALLLPLYQLAIFVVWILLVIKAYQNQMFKLPVIGDLAEKQV